MIAGCALLVGCGSPQLMIASNLAQAAIKTSIDYAEKHRPTPEQAWAREQHDLLVARARGGDLQAQYRLGVLYAAAHDRRARLWMCRAANRGHPEARRQLGHWYNEARKREDLWPFIALRTDDRDAYVWYSLAARAGDREAGVFRERVRRGLNETRRREAERRLAAWRPSPCRSVFTARAENTTGATANAGH